MADAKTINGYTVKDEQARNDVKSIIDSFSYSDSDEIETPFTYEGYKVYRRFFSVTDTVLEGNSMDLVTLPEGYNYRIIAFNGVFFNGANRTYYPLNYYEPSDGTAKSFICSYISQTRTLKFTLNSYGYGNRFFGYIDYLK